MPLAEFKEGAIIHKAGDPLTEIYLIAEGEVEASFGGYTFLYGKTDIIGLSDLSTGYYSKTYTAISDVSICPYRCENMSSLESLLRDNADIAYMMVCSMCRRISELMKYRGQLKQEVGTAYNMIQEIYSEYSRLCKMYASTPKKLPGLDDITPFSGIDAVEDWMHSYYVEISELGTTAHKMFFHGNPGIASGFLHRSVDDIALALSACSVYQEYLKGISSFLLDSNGFDMFSLISDLHLNSLRITGADFAVETLMAPLTEALSGMTGIDTGYYQDRLDAYWDALETRRDSEETSDAPTEQGLSQELLDSMETILKYSGCDEITHEKFTRCVQGYTELKDRNSTDDEVYELRRDLNKLFYALYNLIFRKSLNDPSPPTVIKMFLNFGYVDPALAGYENAAFMYSIADSYKGDPENNIYTISEWLAAVYTGKKEPSLSEFDMDFTAYARDLKNTKQIDATEEARLLKDQEAKLRYEMENAFPVVNRVTFGNPTKFCPVFADHNVLRKPEDTLVTAVAVKNILDEIRSIDFTAYYRETAYTDQKLGITSETVNVEILPNIILMPNVGLRGSMWQEIEGRLRTTPARMFMPIFLENDLKTTVTRLTGEFRWEMCKRIQGARWNDLTDPSLTSYYCDYLQFYMNNRSIAMQTMNEIRNELSAARNNFKTVFVTNYIAWLQNESKGQARLNSIVIGIFMTFMPFTSGIREQLKTNMRYNEALTRYNIKRQKRVQRLTLLIKKISQSGKGVPQELREELEYAQR
jgi:hypothetical protein